MAKKKAAAAKEVTKKVKVTKKKEEEIPIVDASVEHVYVQDGELFMSAYVHDGESGQVRRDFRLMQSFDSVEEGESTFATFQWAFDQWLKIHREKDELEEKEAEEEDD